MCIFAEDENVQLVSTETPSSENHESLLACENGSPVVSASDGAAATGSVSLADSTVIGDGQHSVHGCLCVENTSELSPTHVTQCLLNSVMSSSVPIEMMNKYNGSRDSYQTQGLFVLL